MLCGTAISINSLYILVRSVTDVFLMPAQINFCMQLNRGLVI